MRSNMGSVRDIVSLLFRRKVIFLAIFALIFTAATLSAAKQKVAYVAEAKVRVERGSTVSKGVDSRPHLHWWEEMKTEKVTAEPSTAR